MFNTRKLTNISELQVRIELTTLWVLVRMLLNHRATGGSINWLTLLSIKGKITERWLVEREGIFFLNRGHF